MFSVQQYLEMARECLGEAGRTRDPARRRALIEASKAHAATARDLQEESWKKKRVGKKKGSQPTKWVSSPSPATRGAGRGRGGACGVGQASGFFLIKCCNSVSASLNNITRRSTGRAASIHTTPMLCGHPVAQIWLFPSRPVHGRNYARVIRRFLVKGVDSFARSQMRIDASLMKAR
jgi:hypothetical protein